MDILTCGPTIAINHTCGMVAVEVDDGITIIEVLSDMPEIGDEVYWLTTDPSGSEKCFNRTSDKPMDVLFQNHSVAIAAVASQLLVERDSRCEADLGNEQVIHALLAGGATISNLVMR